jgi:uncharacterized membrane protein YesL
MRVVELLGRYFRNFHRILLTNILFALPAAAFFFGVFALSRFCGINHVLITFLPVFLLSPFFAGVTVITRNIARDDDDISVLRQYFAAIKQNWKRFLLIGALLYAAVVICYSSLMLYWNLAQQNPVFYIPLGVVVLIAIWLLFTFYNIPVMTVTYDLSFKNILKNSALMSFGEMKNNFFATLGLAVTILVGATLYIISNNLTAMLIMTGTYAALILPATAACVVNYYIFKDMAAMITAEGSVSAYPDADDKPKEPEKLDFSDLDLDPKKDGEEYLFFNGKMIKRRVLIEMRDSMEQKNEQA